LLDSASEYFPYLELRKEWQFTLFYATMGSSGVNQNK